MQYTMYQIPLLLSSIVSAVLIFIILKRERTLGSKYLVLFLSSVFIWSFADFFNLLSTNLADKLFWETYHILEL